VAYQQFNKSPITLDLASMVLRDMSANPDQCRIKIDDILKIVGRHFNVARTDLLSPRRARSIVVPRQVGMYSPRNDSRCFLKLPEVWGRDHSTVPMRWQIDDQIKSDDRLAGKGLRSMVERSSLSTQTERRALFQMFPAQLRVRSRA
jgi:chromosomal replication initiator protein